MKCAVSRCRLSVDDSSPPKDTVVSDLWSVHAKLPPGRAMLLPSRSQLPFFADNRSPSIPDARDKSRLGPSNRLQLIEKHRVFAVRGRAGMLGLHFCPWRHSCPAAFGIHKAATCPPREPLASADGRCILLLSSCAFPGRCPGLRCLWPLANCGCVNGGGFGC